MEVKKLTDNEILMSIQERYIATKDISILGEMLTPNLLPLMAVKYIKIYLYNKKWYIKKEEIYDISIDCSMIVINHIEQGILVRTSFYEKMRQTVSNYYRDKNVEKQKEIKYINEVNYLYQTYYINGNG